MYDEDENEGTEQDWARPIAQVDEPINALVYLQSIYRNPSEPEGRRMRAAIEALPYEVPKLSAMALTTMSGSEFARRLDAAIERSAKVIEHRPNEGNGNGQ